MTHERNKIFKVTTATGWKSPSSAIDTYHPSTLASAPRSHRGTNRCTTSPPSAPCRVEPSEAVQPVRSSLRPCRPRRPYRSCRPRQSPPPVQPHHVLSVVAGGLRARLGGQVGEDVVGLAAHRGAQLVDQAAGVGGEGAHPGVALEGVLEVEEDGDVLGVGGMKRGGFETGRGRKSGERQW